MGRGLFELDSRDRLLPMEGLRGIAVGLVFLQHYCMQYTTLTHLDGWTACTAIMFRGFGNRGVELFFVLSGFLIYSVLLKKRPAFISFMLRRAQRLYPAFVVALAFGVLLDITRPTPKIPPSMAGGAAYMLANMLFLPGLLPIVPLFTVNWSLSYEWWFYAACTFLVSVCAFGALSSPGRVPGIAGLAAGLVAAAAVSLPGVPIRGLCLLAGMLLAETRSAGWRPVPSGTALILGMVAFLLCVTLQLSAWMTAVVVAVGFYAICSAALHEGSAISRPLSWKYLRWLGNISYSFYLVHAFAVAGAIQLITIFTGISHPNISFWAGMPFIFTIAFCFGALLFLIVEKPYSLHRQHGYRRRFETLLISAKT